MRLFEDHPNAYAYRIEDGNGTVVSEANGRLIPPQLSATSLPPHLIKATVAAAEPNRSMAAIHRVAIGGAPAYVTFASVSDPARLTWGIFSDEIVGHVIAPLLPFALLLTAINLWTLRRALAPLAAAAEAANRIQDAPGLEPLPEDGLPKEVAALVGATNAALGRLSRALEAERAFTAEAAHALRTPLAVLSARLDTLPSQDGASALRPDIEAITRLVNQMLAAAQADTLVVDPHNEFDLAQTARDVVAQMAPLALKAGRSIAQEGSERVRVRGDADAIAHALRNLLENALRHAPRGSEGRRRAGRSGRGRGARQRPGHPR